MRDDDNERYVGFEVFWQQEGWFWRPLLTLDWEAVGPFTKSTEAHQNAVASKPRTRPRPTRLLMPNVEVNDTLTDVELTDTIEALLREAAEEKLFPSGGQGLDSVAVFPTCESRTKT